MEIKGGRKEKIRGLVCRTIECLKGKGGSGVPMAAAVTLALLVIFCGISEYFRLQIIAVGVRDALEDAIISVVNDNYAGVYHGVREGYSGSYQPFGEDAWEETLDTGDVYGQLDRILGTQLDGGRRIKYMGDGQTEEFALDGLEVTIRNAPFAPSDPSRTQRFEAEGIIRMEAPVRFLGKMLLPLEMELKVQAGYTEVF